LDLTGLTKKQTKGRWKTVYYVDGANEIKAKVCTVCAGVKTVEEYSKHKSGLGGSKSNCKACDHEKRCEYYEINRKKTAEDARNWQENNRERYTETARKWRKKNLDKRALNHQRRRARKAALPDDFTTEQMTETLAYFNGGCALTGATENIHWDHVVPLSTGFGGTTYGNMIPLRGDLNVSKSDGNIFDWFDRNEERFGLDRSKFDALIDWLAEVNGFPSRKYYRMYYVCTFIRDDEAI
jgi:hypothetical protein